MDVKLAAWKHVRIEVNQPRVLGHYFNNDHGHFVQAKHEKIRNNYPVEIILSYDDNYPVFYS